MESGFTSRDAHQKYRSVNIELSEMDIPKYFVFNGLLNLALRGTFHPVNVVKIRMQIDKGSENQSALGKCRSIFQESGYKGFCRGVKPIMLGGLVSNVIYGAIFEFTKEKMMDSASDSWKPIVPFIAGGVAAFPNQIFNVPADVVAVRQVASSSNISATSVLRSIYNSEGIFGLYRGVHMSLMLDLKYAAIWWGVYMNAKCWLYKISGLNPDEDRSALFDPYSIGIQASGGVVAGIIAASLTNPLDVVKTVVQTRGKTASFNVDGSKSYASISIQEILKEIMKENGFWGFFRGIRARLIQVPLVSGLSIVGYEFVKRLSLKDPI